MALMCNINEIMQIKELAGHMEQNKCSIYISIFKCIFPFLKEILQV